MKDLGSSNVLLGIKVYHEADVVILTQRHYVDLLLDFYNMRACRAVATPLVPNQQLDCTSIKEIAS